MLDDQLNAAIDEVARQMTDVAPREGAGFRRRVIARIEASDAPRRNWRAAFVLSPIAVAMAIVIAVMFVRRPVPLGPGNPADPDRLRQGYGGLAEPHAKAEGPAAQAQTQPDASGPARAEAARASARLAEAPATRRRFGPGIPIGPGIPAPNGSAPEIAVLNVSPLQVDSIGVPAIETDSLQLQKLDAIAPIGVTPLGSPSEGDQP
jgi:hypothetical protein